MLLQVFLLGLIPAYASDFLILVVDASGIPESGEFTCVQSGSTLWTVPLWVDEEVPCYRAAPTCDEGDITLDGVAPGLIGLFSSFSGFLLYPCENFHTVAGKMGNEICDFHNKGTMNSLHVVYKGAKMGDKVIFSKGQSLEFGFDDIYDGREMSYGNFVGVFDPSSVFYKIWKFAVGENKGDYDMKDFLDRPGTKQEVTGDGDDSLVSYVYPGVNDVPSDYNDPFVLSVGVFGTSNSHHFVHSCVKRAPHGHCMHSNSKTFTKVGSDMLVIALPNDMENYYFEYSVFKLSGTDSGGIYDRVIFKTSVVGLRMIDSFQKIVFFSNEVAGGMFVATNLMTCKGTLETCMSGRKKSFKLTFYGYTKAVQVQKLIVHGGDIVVMVEDKDCQEQNSHCIVTAELFAYRYTQMWIEDMKETHNGVIDPDDNYRAMIFQDITLVIEPAE